MKRQCKLAFDPCRLVLRIGVLEIRVRGAAVRPEIQSLNDLVGKKVNFNTQGTAAAYSGPFIFSRLSLEVEKTFIPHQVAL
jgi:hypothetical protein